MSIRYRVRHKTAYDYGCRVPLCHNDARVLPRPFAWQEVLSEKLTIEPEVNYRSERTDYFGNRVVYYSIQHPHSGSSTVSEFDVMLHPERRPDVRQSSTAWKALQKQLHRDAPGELLPIRPWMYASPHIPYVTAVTAYAQETFSGLDGLMEGCAAFMKRIFDEFTFDAKSTTVTTTVADAFSGRSGVCQDFTQIMLAGLRGLGLPARYMSGYIETLPAAGEVKLEGADATHAWVAVYDPAIGWVDFDPTNNLLPSAQHITLGWGRDFGDIIPVKGVVTGGSRQTLDVSVDVKRV